MSGRPQGGALQTIFAFFLGLMVTAFVGVGVYTFYPPPQVEVALEMEALNRREVVVRDSRAPAQLTDDDRAALQAIAEERNALADRGREARQGWGRVTSVVLIALATAVMAISLVGAAGLPALGNGLLMGGLFTMVYGVGWIITTDTSVVRFVVMALALAITLVLGYVRFVRRQPAGPPPAPGGDAGLEPRVRALEDRLEGVARALGGRDPRA